MRWMGKLPEQHYPLTWPNICWTPLPSNSRIRMLFTAYWMFVETDPIVSHETNLHTFEKDSSHQGAFLEVQELRLACYCGRQVPSLVRKSHILWSSQACAPQLLSLSSRAATAHWTPELLKAGRLEAMLSTREATAKRSHHKKDQPLLATTRREPTHAPKTQQSPQSINVFFFF